MHDESMIMVKVKVNSMSTRQRRRCLRTYPTMEPTIDSGSTIVPAIMNETPRLDGTAPSSRDRVPKV
jgi:hypothetical protein